MALPHITNSEAGRKLMDPVYQNLFEVSIQLPGALNDKYGKDINLLTEHVLKISGLNALAKGPSVSKQSFMGVDRSYLQSKVDGTSAEIGIDFTLNLRNGNDNYIYKIFREWAALGYNINTGERHLKKDYVAPYMQVLIANRQGDVYHKIVFKDIIMNGGVEGIDELNYDSGEAVTVSVKFVSDWWEEVMS
jgi:hypothetical protein